MHTIKGFDKLGLSGRDSRVYLALLREGLSSIRHISDRTGINRGSVYESIKNLSAAGLVNFQQANVNKKYFAEEPSKILQLIKERKEQLDELEQTTNELIPELVKSTAYLPYANIKFYEDDEGIARILRDVLESVEREKKKEYYAISSKPMRKYLYNKFQDFTDKRIEREIRVKSLGIGGSGQDAAFSQRRWLEIDPDSRPTSYSLIYGDKFAMIALNDNLNPYGVVIEDAGVAQMQKVIFDHMWKSAKK